MEWVENTERCSCIVIAFCCRLTNGLGSTDEEDNAKHVMRKNVPSY
jgi:hypothetical protein